MSDSKLVKKEVFEREKDFSTIRNSPSGLESVIEPSTALAQAGKIKTVRFGASRLIPRSEVERILRRGF